MVVRLLITSCHCSENLNAGPLSPQPPMMAMAMMKAHGVPTATEIFSANLRNIAFIYLAPLNVLN